MPMKVRSLRWLFPALLGGLAVAGPLHAEDSPGAATLETWQRAADPHSKTWSREAMLDGLLNGVKIETLDRQRVLALLGPPGFASESYYPGQGLSGRLDLYRLSAKNGRSFRVNYRPSGQVETASTDATPCVCPLCRDLSGNTDIIIEDAVVTDLLTVQLVSADHQTIKLAELEQLVGHVGKRSLDNRTIGGQAWVNYNVAWRISGGGGEHFLVAGGHITSRDWDTFEEARIQSYDLITLTAECEAP